jgi:sporulation protein YlmC with PRC-barrel domain
MRQLRAIIVISIVVGVISLTIPLRFYGVMSSIFGTLTPAPFNFTVVRTLTIVLALPAVTLILMGIALYYVVEKLEKVAELEVIRESGEALGRLKKVRVEDEKVESFVTEKDREIDKEDVLAIDDTVIVKLPENEFEEKEVYSDAGEFLGYVKDVKSDAYGDVAALEVKKKDKTLEIPIEDVLNVDKIVIVKARPQSY